MEGIGRVLRSLALVVSFMVGGDGDAPASRGSSTISVQYCNFEL